MLFFFHLSISFHFRLNISVFAPLTSKVLFVGQVWMVDVEWNENTIELKLDTKIQHATCQYIHKFNIGAER